MGYGREIRIYNLVNGNLKYYSMLKVPCAQVGFMKFNIVVVYDKENNLLIFHESAMQKYAKSTDINSSV